VPPTARFPTQIIGKLNEEERKIFLSNILLRTHTMPAYKKEKGNKIYRKLLSIAVYFRWQILDWKYAITFHNKIHLNSFYKNAFQNFSKKKYNSSPTLLLYLESGKCRKNMVTRFYKIETKLPTKVYQCVQRSS
jgi:hypothetical protein